MAHVLLDMVKDMGCHVFLDSCETKAGCEELLISHGELRWTVESHWPSVGSTRQPSLGESSPCYTYIANVPPWPRDHTDLDHLRLQYVCVGL